MVLIAFPPNIKAVAPIVLTNSQSVATPAPFQQMVSVNMSKYSGYAASNLQNIEFFYTDGTLIPSWLESGSGSTTATWWLSIANGIGANSSLTVYMGFAEQSVNLFDGVTVGEAPQLSGTYGQYDNGAKVFSFYDNFAGTSLPAGWTGSGYTVNDGITIPYSSYAITNTTYLNPANILEMYGTIPTPSSSSNALAGYTGSNSAIEVNTVSFDINNTLSLSVVGITSTTTYFVITTGIGIGKNIWSIVWQSSSSALFSVNYGTILQLTGVIPTSALPIGFANTQGLQSALGPFYWVRIRAYPPGGTMPSVTADPPLNACAGSTYPLVVAQIVRPSLAPKGVSPKANSGSLFILQNACPAPVETLAQAQQQLANQKYLTPAYTITLQGA